LRAESFHEITKDPCVFADSHSGIERLVRVDQTARESRAAILKDGTRLHVSRTRYTRIQQLLGL
jgi:hypothetical protein